MSSRDENEAEQSGNEPAGNELTRRAFAKLTGVAAGGALLGGAGVRTAAAETADAWDDFRNWRAIEAQKVWERGYRGRPDRTIGLTDTGQDARHPELGPWNGVTAFIDDGQLKLTKPEQNDIAREKSGESEHYEGTMSAGTFATGEEKYIEFTTPSDVDELDSTLSWSPIEDNDLEFRLDVWTGSRWETEARAATGNEPEKLMQIPVESGTKYRYVIEAYLNTDTNYTIDGTYYDITGSFHTYDDSVVFEDVGGDITPDTPKSVGWYDAGGRYGIHDKPRDPHGHGSHCSSIMAGTGRGSSFDPDVTTIDEPNVSLADGESLSYTVDAPAGTNVFGVSYGSNEEVSIYGPDGNLLDSGNEPLTQDATPDDAGLLDNIVVLAPTVHGSGTATYTVEVHPFEGDDVSGAEVNRVAVGATQDPDSTTGDREDNADGIHSGLAPNQSIICLQGLSAPTEDLGRFADQFADTFNLRSVNMSWGYVGGLPLGAAAGTFDRIPSVIKDIAQAGILTCAAAGNSATPLNGNGAPAVSDEAISVCATGPRDGLSAYTSGGIGAVDEDEEDTYMKPDVTAPGGLVDDLVNAAMAGDANAAESDQPPIRDFTGMAGTSMASPFTNGTAGVVAQAMEEDGGPRLGLPEPSKTTFDDVMRLKQVLLATASETALVAAPYHRAHTPTYDFGGRDPYEGFGRVNPDAAVDAVTRELSGTTSEQVGLNLPHDSRAAAGYVDLGVGELDASVEFTGYDGADAGKTTGDPHIDLFVYDGGTPEKHGEPNIVDRAAGVAGSASVSASEEKGGGGSTYLVVAKLVNVPGAANGDDIQVNFDLTVDKTPGVRARGRREEGSSLLGTGLITTVEVSVEPDADVTVRDIVPEEWNVVSDLLSVVTDDEAGVKYVELGSAPAGEATTFTYEVETPTSSEILDFPKEHLFGPVQVDDGSGWTGVTGTTGTKEVKGD